MERRATAGARLSPVALALLIGLPAALTVAYAFAGGGYFVGSTGFGAVALLVVLLLRVLLADDPFAGLGRALAVVAGALAALALWTLLSAYWSESPARALIELDRALLYLAALTLFGSIVRSDARTAWALRALVLALIAVCAIGLLSRVLPEVWPVSLEIAADRLSYPLTYWNALGLMAAIGVVLALHLTCSEREPVWVRAAGAAGLPLLTCCLYFTLSRGAIAVAAIGVVMYLLVARPRGAVGGLLVAVPLNALALVAAYRAELLTTGLPATPEAVAQGQDAALAIAICVVLAALLRLAVTPLDGWLARIDVDPRTGRRAGLAIGGSVAAVALVAALAAGLPGWAGDQYDRFAEGTTIEAAGDNRSRLVDPANNGRIDQWRVAADGFRANPIRGGGAGTHAILWERERPDVAEAQDAHSLYLETLEELGVVGLLLLLVAIGGVLVAFAARARGEGRHLYAALLAAGLVWALHAGIDWDWELPAVTLWLWAFGGMALAAPAPPSPRPPSRFARVLLGVGCLVVAITPALMAVSQQRLNASVDAFQQGDCRLAIDRALGSLKAMPVRPQPFEVLGYCDMRLGLDRLAERSFESAIDRDPENWELHYGLAIVRGAAGRDPRAAARAARRLNPRSPLTRGAVRGFATDDPRKWRRRALSARLPI